MSLPFDKTKHCNKIIARDNVSVFLAIVYTLCSTG